MTDISMETVSPAAGSGEPFATGNREPDRETDGKKGTALAGVLAAREKRERMSGILVHPTSFPSRYGIGDLGKGAEDLIDFLADSHQHIWQVLPLGPTGFGDSPYQSLSAFAGQPYIISPDLLREDGLLTDEDLRDVPQSDPRRVNYGEAITYKMGLLHKAYDRFCRMEEHLPQDGGYDERAAARGTAGAGNGPEEKTGAAGGNFPGREPAGNGPEEKTVAADGRPDAKTLQREFVRFTEREKDWLPDYALFMAVKDYFEGRCWLDWDEDIREGRERAKREYAEKLKDAVRFYEFIQFLFDRQWNRIRLYAAKKDVWIIGDIPIFMSGDCADVWAQKKLFRLDSKGYPLEVAGVPPDYFCATGQLWGNPLYDWDYHEKTGYHWWISRIRRQLELVDFVRIDHFRGFESYWAVPYGEETAVNGTWRKGPGEKLFGALREAFGEDMPIIAEDLGVITPEVEKLRDEFGLPGMKVLQFGFGDMNDRTHIPHFYQTSNCVCYTGTHDNETTVGWYQHQPEEVKDRIRLYGNCDGGGVSLDFIRFAMGSVAKYAIFPIQDLLQLGNEGRMNTPGVAADNWSFRYEQSQLQGWMRDWLVRYTKVFSRE